MRAFTIRSAVLHAALLGWSLILVPGGLSAQGQQTPATPAVVPAAEAPTADGPQDAAGEAASDAASDAAKDAVRVAVEAVGQAAVAAAGEQAQKPADGGEGAVQAEAKVQAVGGGVVIQVQAAQAVPAVRLVPAQAVNAQVAAEAPAQGTQQAAPVQPVGPQPIDQGVGPSGTLRLINGDYLFGRMAVLDDPTRMAWASNVFQLPAKFDFRGVERIDFGAATVPQNAAVANAMPRGPQVVQAVNGFFNALRVGPQPVAQPASAAATPAEPSIRLVGEHRISGRVIGIDEQWLTIQSARHGQVRLHRSAVVEVEGVGSGSSLLSGGLQQFGRWASFVNLNQPDDGTSWQQEPAGWNTVVRGAARSWDAGAEQRLLLEMKLSGKAKPEFQVLVGGGPAFNELARGFSVEPWQGELVLYRQIGDRVYQRKLEVPKLEAGNWSVDLKMFVDLAANKAAVVVRDKLVGELETPAPPAGLVGPHQASVVVRNRGTDLTVSAIELRRWNGPLNAVGVKAEAKDVVVLSDGQTVVGDLKSIDVEAGTVVLVPSTGDGNTGERKIELAQVDRVLPGRNEEQARKWAEALAQAPVKVDYEQGTNLRGEFAGVQADGMVLKVPVAAEPVLIGWDGLSQITVTHAQRLEPESAKHGVAAADYARIHGKIVNSTEATALNWEPVFCDTPMAFAGAGGIKVHFDPVATKMGASQLKDRVSLVTGDTIPCDLVAIDGTSAQVRLADGRVLQISKDDVKMLQQSSESQWLYQGFSKGDKWLVAPKRQEAIRMEQGGIGFVKSAHVARKIELPPRMRVSFDVQWRQDVPVTVTFGTDNVENALFSPENIGWTQEMMEQLQKQRPDYAGEVMLQKQGNALTATGTSKAAGLLGQMVQRNFGFNNGYQPTPLVLGDSSHAHIDILIDRARREYVVLGNGKEMVRWRDPTQIEGEYLSLGVMGLGDDQGQVVYGANSDGTVSGTDPSKPTGLPAVVIHNLRVGHWQGALPEEDRKRFLTRRLGSLPKAVTHIIRAFNGDSLRGQLLQIQPQTVLFKTRQQTISVPRNVVAEVISLQPVESSSAAPSTSEPIASVRLRTGETLMLKLPKTSEQYLVGDVDRVGSVSVPWALVDSLQLATQRDQSENLSLWTLIEPPPLPEDEAPQGEGGTKSTWLDQPAPDMNFTMLAGGEKVALKDLRGKIVVLDFWATWCGPCLVSLPSIMELSNEFPEEVRLIAVNQQEEGADITEFLASREWDLPVALDEDGALGRLMQVEAIPFTVIVDQEGIVRHVHVGAAADLKDQLTAVIRKLLDKPAHGTTPAPQTP